MQTLSTAKTLRDKAAAMQKMIDKKLNPAVARQNSTPRRERQIASSFEEGARLTKIQKGMLGLANAIENNNVPITLRSVTTPYQVAVLLFCSEFDRDEKVYDAMCNAELDRQTRFEVAKESLASFVDTSQVDAARAALQMRQRATALIGVVPGYFPTPAKVVAQMLKHVNFQFGDRFLDPSCGGGAMYDGVKEILPDLDIQFNGIELDQRLVELAQSKGYQVDHYDALSVTNLDHFTHILMNPPFEGTQAADHVTHAFNNFLAEGGTLVSVVDTGCLTGSSKSDVAFQNLIEQHGYTQELPKNSFKESKTGVNTALVILTK